MKSAGRRRRAGGFGLAAPDHTLLGAKALERARQYAKSAARWAERGSCMGAHDDIRVAALNLGEAIAHHASGGAVPFEPVSDALNRAELAFERKCRVVPRGSR